VVISAVPRGDALPENIYYQDVGCELHPYCLTCPLPVCKEELTRGVQSVRIHMRNLQVALLTDEGHSVDWIAQVMGISASTVHRSLRSENRVNVLLTDTTRRATMSIAAQAIASSGR
jgi:hypothetical protein